MNAYTTHDIHGKPYNRNLMILLLLVATFAGVLNQTSLGTAIPTLMKSFHISMSTAQQATTWFLLANGIMIPVSAFLATRFSTKKLYISAYSLIILGLLITTFTPTSNWSIFLFGRIIQACGVGITMPLMQVVMVNVFPAEERGAAMGLNGLVVGLAPAVGPTLAGWILKQDFIFYHTHLLWRAIFILPLIILIITLIFSPFIIKDVIANEAISLDMVSLLLSVLGFGSFLWGFSNVASHGWSDPIHVIVPILLGIAIIALFALKQLHMKRPFLNVAIFKNKQFSVTTAAIAFAMMAMMGVEMMLAPYMQNVHGLSALQSGLALLPGALVMGIVSPIAGKVYDKIGARPMALIGFSILAIGTIPFIFFSADMPVHFITLLYAVRMFGIAVVLMPLTASAMSALPPHQASHATAANNTVRQIASAVVVALLSSVTQNIINTHKPLDNLKLDDPIQYANQTIEASLDGFHASFAIGVAFAIIGFLISLLLRKGKVIATEKGEQE
ncbi:MDR family MFS transporter [Streptococcus sp. zg-JUN1979]|uniref:MDR family MFS transporter n=1 Tax=Streptococcus sp. zg-JUN1979 TaxID=3391450 RepID=UPI0039A45C08